MLETHGRLTRPPPATADAAVGRGSGPLRARRARFAPEIVIAVRALTGSDNRRNFLYIAGDYGMIAASVAACYALPYLLTYLAALVVIGSRMRALDNLTHECSHNLLFRHRRLNRWVGMLLCSFPVGTSPHAYWSSHMAHHQNLGDPHFDPDLVRYRELGVDRFPIRRRQLILHLLRVVALTHVPRYLLGTVRSFIYNPSSPRDERVAFFAYWGAVLTTVTLAGWWLPFLLFWVVPFLTTFQVLRYLAEISEHGGLYFTSEREIDLVRNNFCHPWWRPFQYPHGDHFHLVHHLFPGLPHFNLASAHGLLMSDRSYRRGHHCFGYFFCSQKGRESTFGEMVRAEEDDEVQEAVA